MKWIKTDIDGTGEKWRLAVLREHGTMYYFPKEKFEDLVENYEDCERLKVANPDIVSDIVDEIAEAIGSIADGELWAGRAWCRSCAHEWIACAPFGTDVFECPKCGRMDGKKKFSSVEEAAGRIATALINVLGMPAKDALAVMGNLITQVIPENDARRGQWKEALRFLAMDD